MRACHTNLFLTLVGLLTCCFFFFLAAAVRQHDRLQRIVENAIISSMAFVMPHIFVLVATGCMLVSLIFQLIGNIAVRWVSAIGIEISSGLWRTCYLGICLALREGEYVVCKILNRKKNNLASWISTSYLHVKYAHCFVTESKLQEPVYT